MRWWLFASGVGVYAAALVASAPATWFDAGLQRVGDGRLRLVEADGTLWSGKGRIEIREVGGRKGWTRQVAWQLRPAGLLRGRLAYNLSLEPGRSPVALTVAWQRVELEDLDIVLPAAAVGVGVPQLAPLALLGDLHLKAAALSVERGGMLGSATMQWHEAGSSLSPLVPLGDYELRVMAEGLTSRASLHTLKGPLQLDGSGTWAHSSKPALQVTAYVPPSFEPQVAPFLRLFAIERSAGNFQLQFND